MEEFTFIKGKLLTTMLVLAPIAHEDQFDKQGEPYILHPIIVMINLYLSGVRDEELLCIALGHDVVEDNRDITYERLRLEGLSPRIVEGIKALTKVPGETNDQYEQRVLKNPDARKVKMKDLDHNMDISRIKDPGPKDIARIGKYRTFYMKLKAAEVALTIELRENFQKT